MKDSRATQRGRILELLIRAHGDWVPLPQIAACAAQYNARIFELRRLGFSIKNKTQEVNGQKRSWFRLETGLAQSAAATSSAPARERRLPLFTEGGQL